MIEAITEPRVKSINLIEEYEPICEYGIISYTNVGIAILTIIKSIYDIAYAIKNSYIFPFIIVNGKIIAKRMEEYSNIVLDLNFPQRTVNNIFPVKEAI